jgi:AcrR family transcriptional regulator
MVQAIALVERLEPYGTELDERIVAATLDCVARWGLAKTTLDDIARAAGCSRATVSRTFPGGKDALVEHVGQRELERFFGALARELADAATVEDALVIAIHEASVAIRRHGALQYLCAHEPEVLLPYLSFDGLAPLLGWSGEFGAVHLARFLDPDTGRDLGEWACRIVLTYSELQFPVLIDLTDESEARTFVRTYVLPGVHALVDERSAPTSGPATATGASPVAELDPAPPATAVPATSIEAPPRPALVPSEE